MRKPSSGQREGFRHARTESCLHGESCWQANQQQDILCDWLRVHIWLSLVGPRLEVETRGREAVSY